MEVFSIVGLISGILLPSLLLAKVREPIFDLNGPSALLMMSVGQAAAIFSLELAVTATLVGGLAGWIICRTHSASLATALAGLIFALRPGHNNPIGNTPGTLKGVAILFMVVLVSTIVLVEIHAWITSTNNIKTGDI
jgi:hypothetical protein